MSRGDRRLLGVTDRRRVAAKHVLLQTIIETISGLASARRPRPGRGLPLSIRAVDVL